MATDVPAPGEKTQGNMHTEEEGWEGERETKGKRERRREAKRGGEEGGEAACVLLSEAEYYATSAIRSAVSKNTSTACDRQSSGAHNPMRDGNGESCLSACKGHTAAS